MLGVASNSVKGPLICYSNTSIILFSSQFGEFCSEMEAVSTLKLSFGGFHTMRLKSILRVNRNIDTGKGLLWKSG
jgi:hypothetical protein